MTLAPWSPTGSFVCALLLVAAEAMAGEPAPELDFPPPRGWIRSLTAPAGGVGFVSPGPPARIDVYPFRPFVGSLEPAFGKTLLRERVGESQREAAVRGTPTVEDFPVQGADAARSAIFVEDRGGTLRYRVRVAAQARNAVALVDLIADTEQTLDAKGGWPPVLQSLQSMKVVAPAPSQTVPSSGVAGGSSSGRAGLYLAQVNRMYLRPNFSGSGGMTTDYKLDTEFYLLSWDGRVYRGYGLPEVPGGQLRNFDFDTARRKDPGNVGTYTAQGDRVTLRVGDETIAAMVVEGGALRFRNSTYKRAELKRE